MPSRIQIAKPDIVKFLDAQSKSVFAQHELAEMLEANRLNWRLTQSMRISEFIEFLQDKADLQKVTLESDYRSQRRFIWRQATPFQVALSLNKLAYLSHGTAVFLHALTEELPKMIFVNIEQTPKPAASGTLSQESIRRAFSSAQRVSKYVYQYGGYQILMINGKNSGRLEVGRLTGPSGETLEATKLERTLIDIAVRPSYAGGVYKVLDAFKAASSKLSTNTLLATLKKLDYLYPYHQAIGFYLERSGVDESRLSHFRKLPRHFDFYLAHALRDPAYDEKWRLFYPQGM